MSKIVSLILFLVLVITGSPTKDLLDTVYYLHNFVIHDLNLRGPGHLAAIGIKLLRHSRMV
jgi:hypothetical protein